MLTNYYKIPKAYIPHFIILVSWHFERNHAQFENSQLGMNLLWKTVAQSIL